VLLAEDDVTLRGFLAMTIGAEPDCEVVAEAGDGREALELANRLTPELAVVDWFMPILNGYDAARLMLERRPKPLVLIMSVADDERFVVRALRSGVRGYFLKSEERPDQVIPALRAILAGQIYLSPRISRIRDILDRRDLVGEEPLTPRQRNVLQLVAEGRTTKEISGLLEVTEKTVEYHRMRVMEKLGIRDLAGLIRYAYEEGVVLFRSQD
jgi:DNA-binding NarL/FixJ family response regulator